MPKNVDESPCIYSPGIKWNVQPGSYTHMTEFFGPLLGVMSFRSLTEAINIVNESGFGLTSGIESLDDSEQALWLAGIRAGNLYVNRSTTGAIVLRQPFGGMGKSAFGPSIKAGGPIYVAQLMTFTCNAGTEAKSENVSNPALVHLLSGLRKLSGELQPETSQLATAIADYDKAAQDEFLKEHDHFHLIGQDNIRRYLPIPALCVRVTANDTWFDIVARAAAARSVGCRVFISSSPGVLDDWLQILHDLTEEWAADIEFIEETDEQLIEAIETGAVGRIRYSSPEAVPSAIREAVIGNYVHIADSPVLPIGRVELMWYVQEQSVCIDYHRYGNLGARAGEQRAPVL